MSNGDDAMTSAEFAKLMGAYPEPAGNPLPTYGGYMDNSAANFAWVNNNDYFGAEEYSSSELEQMDEGSIQGVLFSIIQENGLEDEYCEMWEMDDLSSIVEQYGYKDAIDEIMEIQIKAKGAESYDDETLYIKNSSIFDNPDRKYDIPLYTKILKEAGATKVWTEPLYGWANQSEVVIFTGFSEHEAKKALKQGVSFLKDSAYEMWFPMIYNKDAHWDAESESNSCDVCETNKLLFEMTDMAANEVLCQSCIQDGHDSHWTIKTHIPETFPVDSEAYKTPKTEVGYTVGNGAETFEADPEYDGLGANDLHITTKEMDKIYEDIRKERKYNMNHPKDGSKVPLSRRKGWELIDDLLLDDSPPYLITEALYEDKRGNSNTFYTIPFHFDLTNYTSPFKINPNDKNDYRWDYPHFNFDPVNPRGYVSLIIGDGKYEGKIISSHRFKEMNAETFGAFSIDKDDEGKIHIENKCDGCGKEFLFTQNSNIVGGNRAGAIVYENLEGVTGHDYPEYSPYGDLLCKSCWREEAESDWDNFSRMAETFEAEGWVLTHPRMGRSGVFTTKDDAQKVKNWHIRYAPSHYENETSMKIVGANANDGKLDNRSKQILLVGMRYDAETFEATPKWECDECGDMHDDEDDAESCCIEDCDHSDSEMASWGHAGQGSDFQMTCNNCGADGYGTFNTISWEHYDKTLEHERTAETFEAEGEIVYSVHYTTPNGEILFHNEYYLDDYGGSEESIINEIEYETNWFDSAWETATITKGKVGSQEKEVIKTLTFDAEMDIVSDGMAVVSNIRDEMVGVVEVIDDEDDDEMVEISIQDENMEEIGSYTLDDGMILDDEDNYLAESKTPSLLTLGIGALAAVFAFPYLKDGVSKVFGADNDTQENDPELIENPNTGDLDPAAYEELVVESTGYALDIIPMGLDGSFMGSRFAALPTERYVDYNDPGIGAHTDIALNRDEVYLEPEMAMVQASEDVKEAQAPGQSPYLSIDGQEPVDMNYRVIKETHPISLDPAVKPFIPQSMAGYTGNKNTPPSVYNKMFNIGVLGQTPLFTPQDAGDIGASHAGSRRATPNTLGLNGSVGGPLSDKVNANYTDGQTSMSLAQWAIENTVSQSSDTEAVVIDRSSGAMKRVRRV